MEDDKDLATEGLEDRIEGTADVVEGRIRGLKQKLDPEQDLQLEPWSSVWRPRSAIA